MSLSQGVPFRKRSIVRATANGSPLPAPASRGEGNVAC